MFVLKNTDTPKQSQLESFIKFIIGTYKTEDIKSSQRYRIAKTLWDYYNEYELNEETGAKIENFMNLFVEPPLKKVNLEDGKEEWGATPRISANFGRTQKYEKEQEQKEEVDPAFVLIKDFIGMNKTFYKERILYIIGDMGSGKTTLCKYLCYSSLQAIINHKNPLSANYIPIFIKASSFIKSIIVENSNLSPMEILLKIFTEFRLENNSIGNLMDYDLIPTLFLIDGIDEVDINLRDQLFTKIDMILRKFPNLKVILTFRQSILSDILNSANLLNYDQVFSTEKWSEEIIIEYIGYKLQNDTQLLNELRNNNINKPEPRQLWEKLSGIFDIKELSTNPFMLNAILDLLPLLVQPDDDLTENIDRILIYDFLIKKRIKENLNRMRSIINNKIKIPLREKLWYAFIRLLAFFIMASPSNNIKIEPNYNPARDPSLDINRIMFGQDTIYIEQIITDINPFINQDWINEFQSYGIDLSYPNGQNTNLTTELKNIFLNLIRTNTLFEVSKSETGAYIKLNFIHKSLPEFIVAESAAKELGSKSSSQNHNKQIWFHSMFFSKETFEFFLEIISKKSINLSHQDFCNFTNLKGHPFYNPNFHVKNPELLHIILDYFYNLINDNFYRPDTLKLKNSKSTPQRLPQAFQADKNSINESIKEILRLILENSSVVILGGLNEHGLNFIFNELSNKNKFNNIIKLDLEQSSLSSLPDIITNMTWLKILNIGINNISALPEDIGKLNNLKELNLRWNKLSSLPKSIGRLTNLKILFLEHNKLSSLPKSIGNLKKLEKLYLYKNEVTSLPESIGGLTNLQRLDLDHNKLSSIPESIGHLINLQKLDISYNKLTSLPESIGNLKALKEIDFYENQLSSLPESIGSLINIQKLWINNNKLSNLPDILTKMSWLKELDLSGNKLSSLPEGIECLKDLTTLNLSYNNFYTFPQIITKMTWIKVLDIKGNYISVLPESIGYLTNLELLWFNNNQLSALPESIGNLKNLKGLYLNGNQLSFLPESIGDLEKLKKLYLYKNKLFSLPKNIGNLKSLKELKLSYNRLTSLPKTIGCLTSLETLDLGGNQLTFLPKPIENLVNLTYLSLHHNKLSSLPEWIQRWLNLLKENGCKIWM